jgi:hypothetical protein
MYTSTINNREFTKSINNLIGGSRMHDDKLYIMPKKCPLLMWIQLEEDRDHREAWLSTLTHNRKDSNIVVDDTHDVVVSTMDKIAIAAMFLVCGIAEYLMAM